MALILGIDPGSRKTGFGIINYVSGQAEYVTSGIIRLSDGELAPRLKIIYDSVTELVELHGPNTLAIEQVFMAKSAGSALKLGQARGIAMLAPARAGLSVGEYAPNAVKKAVVGVGHADKKQVDHMVRMQLPGAEIAGPDAADALAIAICHAHMSGTRARVLGAMP